MDYKDWINVVALLLSPVIAVIITFYWNQINAVRNAKMELFKTLMATRYMGNANHERVRALNSIDIIFSDSQKVRTAWSNYYNELCKQGESFIFEHVKDKELKLIEEMARNLNYKEKINWEQIKNFYVPNGLVDIMDYEDISRKMQIDILLKTHEKAMNENQQTINDKKAV